MLLIRRVKSRELLCSSFSWWLSCFWGGLSYLCFYLVMNVHYYLCILIIHCGLPFFYILYKLYVPLVMLLSREVLPDFAILSFSMCCISLVERFFLVSSIVWDQWGVTVGIRAQALDSWQFEDKFDTLAHIGRVWVRISFILVFYCIDDQNFLTPNSFMV